MKKAAFRISLFAAVWAIGLSGTFQSAHLVSGGAEAPAPFEGELSELLQPVGELSQPVGATEGQVWLENVAPGAKYKANPESGINDNKQPPTDLKGEQPWWEYKGRGDGPAGHNIGRLVDGVVNETAALDNYKADEFCNNGEAFVPKLGARAGAVSIIFRLAEERDIGRVRVFVNNKGGEGTGRGWPAGISAYVGNADSFEVSDFTLLGRKELAGFTDPYAGAKLCEIDAADALRGAYVVVRFESQPTGGACIMACSEVEILAVSDVPPEASVELAIPALEAPVLKSSAPRLETYEIPTISWDAVPGAVGYDVWLDYADGSRPGGALLAAENTTALSFTPDIKTRTDYKSGIKANVEDNYYVVQVVAKSGSDAVADSAKSAPAGIVYVEKPTDCAGVPVTGADLIIDAGHGGKDPGAIGFGTRHEADDTLRLSLAAGKMFEDLGFSVAYTRIADVYDSPRTKAAKGGAGEYGVYLCFHRNAYTSPKPKGVMVEHDYKSAAGKKLAQLVQAEYLGLGIFDDRGIKQGKTSTVCHYVNDAGIPVILNEVGFITNEEDNANFDAYFDNIAAAAVRGTMKFLQYKVDYAGTLTVNGVDYEVKRGANTVEVSVSDCGGGASDGVIDYSFVGVHGLGFAYLQTRRDDGEWSEPEDAAGYLSDVSLAGYKSGKRLSYGGRLCFADALPGVHRFCVRAGTLVDAPGAAHPVNEELLFTIEADVRSCFALGDANRDGAVDNLDAALILQYDAGLPIGLDTALADVSADGEADNLDAALVLQYDAGLIGGF